MACLDTVTQYFPDLASRLVLPLTSHFRHSYRFLHSRPCCPHHCHFIFACYNRATHVIALFNGDGYHVVDPMPSLSLSFQVCINLNSDYIQFTLNCKYLVRDSLPGDKRSPPETAGLPDVRTTDAEQVHRSG